MDKYDVRREAIKNLAYRLGGTFSDEDSSRIFPLLKDLPLFRRGFRKQINNVLSLEYEWGKVYMFDYSNTRNRGNHFKRYRRSVCFINARQLGLPEFRLRPSGLLDKVIGLISPLGISFPEHKKFSKRYILNCEDESMARHYFQDDLLDFLSMRKDWHLEGLGYYLVIYGNHLLAEGRELGRLLEESMTIAQMIIGNRYEAGWLLK